MPATSLCSCRFPSSAVCSSCWLLHQEAVLSHFSRVYTPKKNFLNLCPFRELCSRLIYINMYGNNTTGHEFCTARSEWVLWKKAKIEHCACTVKKKKSGWTQIFKALNFNYILSRAIQWHIFSFSVVKIVAFHNKEFTELFCCSPHFKRGGNRANNLLICCADIVAINNIYFKVVPT